MPLDNFSPDKEALQPTIFSLSDEEFEQIRLLVKSQTGISLGLHKRDLVVSRLSRRLRALQFKTFQQYVDYLRSSGGENEIVHMVNRITTNKTDFFREKHHFDLLNHEILPVLLEQGEKTGLRKLKAWSAGCSSGEEPYTLAVTLAEFFSTHPGWDIKVLATDIDTTMLSTASKGEYDQSLIEPMPKHLLSKYFIRQRGSQGFTYKVSPALRRMVTFRKFNMMHAKYPLKPDIDIVFCRNVMIYFDNVDKNSILSKIHGVMTPNGHLFVGHSESLTMVKDFFRYVGTTTYQKI